jgi:hypothetical protein
MMNYSCEAKKSLALKALVVPLLHAPTVDQMPG